MRSSSVPAPGPRPRAATDRRWRAPWRRPLAGQPLAHHQRRAHPQRRLGAVGDLAQAAALVALLEDRGEVGGDALHASAPIASTRACSTASKTARASPPRARARVQCRRDRRASARRRRHGRGSPPLAFGRHARGPGRRRRLAVQSGGSAENVTSSLLAGDATGGERHRALERIERRLVPSSKPPWLSSTPHWPWIAAVPRRSSADRTPQPARAPARRICSGRRREGEADIAEDLAFSAQVITVRGLITVERSPLIKALRVRSATRTMADHLAPPSC